MEKSAVDKVSKQVLRQFPAFKGKQPKIRAQGNDRFLLIFSNSGTTPDGKSLSSTLRVVATADGRIIKTSMSR